MPAHHCATCQTDWPYSTDFKRCPICEVTTSYWPAGSPITKKEADELANNAAFDRFYEQWDQDREKRGESSPEFLGALDAREIVRLERIETKTN